MMAIVNSLERSRHQADEEIMPTPPRTSRQDIVTAARRILESDGLEQLTMQSVAAAVGVRAPSLYKHVRDRGDLIRLVGDDTALELADRLDAATDWIDDPRLAIEALARTYRTFAVSHPQAYRLLFTDLPEGSRIDADANARAGRALFRAVAGLVGDDHALEAARTVVAWAHGFASMELAGAFRLGGDVDSAFHYGIEKLTDAIADRG
jgi:AcrR family transcriptional regulator